jgi:quercetin dioxygenase-like cupin family protein
MKPLQLYDINQVPHDRKMHSGYMNRTAIRSEDVLTIIATLTPHDVVPPKHRHPYEMIVIGLEGNLTLEVEGVEYEVTAGKMMVVPANAIHTGGAKGDKDAKFIEIFSPVRRDYVHLTKYQKEKFKNPEGVTWFYEEAEEKEYEEKA